MNPPPRPAHPELVEGPLSLSKGPSEARYPQPAPPAWRTCWRPTRGSLRWRLVRLFLLMALATTVIFIAGMQQFLRGGWQVYARPLAADYIDRLTAEIGTPPDIDKARALAARLPLTIRIDGPRVQWQSAPRRGHRIGWFHDDDADDWMRDDDNANRNPGWQTRTLADGHRIRFGLANPPSGPITRYTGWATLALLLVVTALAYAHVRRLLRPLDDIRSGALRYGRGRFDEPIAVRRNDELGELAARINTMAAELHGMLDAKRALLLAISHELRSPLTRARINAELVEESEPQRALLRDLGEMRDLISELLESERLATGHSALHVELCVINALVEEVLASHFEGRRITTQLAPAIAPLLLDPSRLRVLLRNLLDNALRHGAGSEAPPLVSTAHDGAQLVLTVRDFGPGVSDEQLAHLAEPFYRVDSARQRSTGGVGLGLHLCRLIAEAHGGTLTIRRAQPGLAISVTL